MHLGPRSSDSSALAVLFLFLLASHQALAQFSNEIPEGSRRSAVVALEPHQIQQQKAATPKAILADGYQLSTVAHHPLVNHPIMACLDPRGRLFVGDGVGVNWNKEQLEANPPNRVLMLEDSDGDGFFEKSTVFADNLTFPQGACWLDGSLYVCSPPGLWRFTDADNNGVAELREKLVDGFDYTGNAADVHGPFLNPCNHRLYWCHGRKGHKATGRNGVVVHEGLASGIWSCKPDGSDLQWHSLGCGDNPVEVDFTADGDILGVQNLYHSNPRGDTLMHYLLGGVYERPDMMKAIDGLPRTLEKMPVIHNFGHVAVSGCTFWRSHHSQSNALQMLVTHFNTGRLSRVELNRSGASYRASENEFLKIQDPDVHLTDVLEDRDGSLLVLNTGGWFRIGCPSSLLAKPDINGAIYRIKPIHKTQNRTPEHAAEAQALPKAQSTNSANLTALLQDHDPHIQRRACEWIALNGAKSPEITAAILELLEKPLDPPLEHAVMYAAGVTQCIHPKHLAQAKSKPLIKRLLSIEDQFGKDPNTKQYFCERAISKLDDEDADLARTALAVAARVPESEGRIETLLQQWLEESALSDSRLIAIHSAAIRLIKREGTRAIVAKMLEHPQRAVQSAGLKVIADQTVIHTEPAWSLAIERQLKEQILPLPLLLDAIKRVKSAGFDEELLSISKSDKHPLSLRLKCLSALKNLRLGDGTFELLMDALKSTATPPSARLLAANILKETALLPEQAAKLPQIFTRAGPLELKPITSILAKTKDSELVRKMTESLALNPSIASQQESVYRTALSSHPADIFDSLLLPALQKANAQHQSKMFALAPLAERLTSGTPELGRIAFEEGRGACISCHQVGDKGRAIGPDLSRIGAIRTGRDLLESIIFPSNTLARDYEAHAIETADGTTLTGVVRGHSAEGLVLMDAAGQEISIPHQKVLSNTTLTESLMPAGLDAALGEADLLNVVSYLQSLK